jgi:hypothetical protein
MEAKWHALGEIAMRQTAADEKRQAEALREHDASVRQLPVIQSSNGPAATAWSVQFGVLLSTCGSPGAYSGGR